MIQDTESLTISTGKHQIEISHPCYETQIQTFEIESLQKAIFTPDWETKYVREESLRLPIKSKKPSECELPMYTDSGQDAGAVTGTMT